MSFYVTYTIFIYHTRLSFLIFSDSINVIIFIKKFFHDSKGDFMTISKGTTIQQIAELANVSTATHPGLSTSLKPLSRRHCAGYFGYEGTELSAKAKYYASSSRYLPNFTNPFYSLCIRGMQEAARKRNYKIYLQQIDDPTKTESYDFLLDNHLFHGIIFTHPLPDKQLLDLILIKHPVVMCSQYSISDDVPCVVIDDYAAAQNAVSYLISIGKENCPDEFTAGLQLFLIPGKTAILIP